MSTGRDSLVANEARTTVDLSPPRSSSTDKAEYRSRGARNEISDVCLLGRQEPGRGRSVRVRDGKALATDGPFAKTKEAVGGFDILECDSLEEAVEIAAGHHLAQLETIEVRPLWGN